MRNDLNKPRPEASMDKKRPCNVSVGVFFWLPAMAALALLSDFDASAAHPFRGSVGWSILLCKYTDSPTPPKSADYFQDMIVRRGTGGLNDYWRAVSLGNVDLDTTVVKGWYTVPMSMAQAKAKSGGPNPHRGELVTDCVAAARNARDDRYSVPPDHNVAAITSPGIDLFGATGHVLLGENVDLGALAHEMGHGLGLGHSYSDDPNHRNASWSGIGEYDDPSDIMSYASVFKRNTDRFGHGGPGFNAYHMDRLGWLPRSRIVTFGADNRSTATITIAAVGHANVAGPFLVRVPFDLSDPFHYYTVEYRRKEGWDSGYPADVVLIHDIAKKADGERHATILRERSGNRDPVQKLDANGVSIAVLSLNGEQATIRLESRFVGELRNPASSTYGPNTCKPGYVWREADALDWICVSQAVRAQARNDNELDASRRRPGAGALESGMCISGFVSRNAFPGDQICTTLRGRAQAAQDNRDAQNRLLMR